MKPGISYAGSVQKKETNNRSNSDLKELTKVINAINEICDIKQMITLFHETKARLAATKAKSEHMLLFIEMCQNLDR